MVSVSLPRAGKCAGVGTLAAWSGRAVADLEEKGSL